MEDCRPTKARFRDKLRQLPRKKRRAIFIAAVVVVASTIAAVWVIDRLERGVALTVYTTKASYIQGESVQIYIQLKNHGFSPATLVYASSLIMSFSIYDSNGLELFTGPRDGAAVITEVVLEPGEVKRQEHTWDQANNAGERVDLPDTFTVRAVSESYERLFRADARFSILGLL